VPNNLRVKPNLPFIKGEKLKIPSLFEKERVGWVKKHYQLFTAGLLSFKNLCHLLKEFIT